VVDADGHVVEPPDLWERYIDRQFAGAAPRTVDAGFRMTVTGRIMPRSSEPSPDLPEEVQRRRADAAIHPLNDDRYQRERERAYDARGHLMAMDDMGVDEMVLYPSRGLYAASVSELECKLSAAICRAYNRWLHDFCSEDPNRLVGAALIGLHDPALAAVEAQYAVEELGLRAIMIRPNPVHGRNLSDPANDVFFAEVERLGVALSTHEGVGVWMPSFGDRYAAEPVIGAAAWHAMAHPVEQMGSVLSFTLGGILERHPRLRVGFLEAGGGWLPYWLWRLDEHAEEARDRCQRAGEEWPLALAPSRYFARQCWISIEPDEPNVAATANKLGVDRLLWATDYPHPECDPKTVVDAFFAQAELTAEEKRVIVGSSPVAFYGLAPTG
jgi:predicted TIM-barrel fold metal-dependent hydrolase